ncbi:hypothetical protein [Glaciecola sp. SC05]|uniref:hypothetical protein n=1 Tax=Glaciecola sp. SC05 TaxID=1987355 RepID=UPI0035275614
MDINTTLMGQMFALFALVAFAFTISIISYILGKRKTETPEIAAKIGFFLGLLPPLSLIYLIVLMLKQDKFKAQDDV